MKTTYKVDGYHVYTIHQLLPFLWRYRINNGKWRYSFNEDFVQRICEVAVHKAINDSKAQRYVQEYCQADIDFTMRMYESIGNLGRITKDDNAKEA